jgi:GNAT superfamily N-acetyltransferase
VQDGRVLLIADATPERWEDVAAVMGTRGDPARCWCQWFRLTPAEWNGCKVADRRVLLEEQVAASPPPGVLAYDATKTPVGWCAVAPRAAYPRLASDRAAAATQDEPGLWAVTCFVVRVGSRKQGVAPALLEGAVELARRHGARMIEGYPVDASLRETSSASLYHGPLSVFLKAGFAQVALGADPARPVVRRTL